MGNRGRLLPLSRAFTALGICADTDGGASFSRLLGGLSPITPGALSRLLKAMLAEKILEKDSSGLYRCGTLVHALSRKVKGAVRMPEAAAPLLDALARDTGRSSAYFEIREGGAFLAAKSEMPEQFHYIDVFRAMPVPASHGFGQVLLAHADARLRELVAPGNGFMKDKAYMRRLKEISGGLQIIQDWGVKNPICRIAAPVFARKRIKGAVGISFYPPAPDDMEIEKIEMLVRNTAERMSELYEGDNDDV